MYRQCVSLVFSSLSASPISWSFFPISSFMAWASSFLTLYHDDEVIGVAGISYFARVFLILRIIGCDSLLPFQLGEFFDDRFSCSTLGSV